jgi:membrane associated rhomboid family serine protease
MAQALVRRRFGLRRFPVVTAVAFGVTAATSVLGLVDADVLAALQRAPEGLHGDCWRTVTSLFVQDGGVPGTLSNLFFLLVMGALAEQVAGRWRWLVVHLVAGLAGELAGYAWQPRRAGNSVGFVAGALAVQLAPPRWAVPAGRLAAATTTSTTPHHSAKERATTLASLRWTKSQTPCRNQPAATR